MLFGESASGQTPGAHWAAGHVGPNFLLALTIWVTNIPSLVPSMFADQEVTTNNSSNLPLSLCPPLRLGSSESPNPKRLLALPLLLLQV